MLLTGGLAFATGSSIVSSVLARDARQRSNSLNQGVSGLLGTPDGHTIPIQTWDAERGCVVVCAHAFGDYRLAYAEQASRLNRAGHAIIAFDQRGFGETRNRAAFAGDALYVRDLARVAAHARSLWPQRRLVLLGESFGGSVILRAMADKTLRLGSVDAVILSGPGVREDLPAKPAWDALISGASALFGHRSVTLNQVDPRLSAAAQERFANDPLVVRELRADTYEQIVAMADAASADASQVKAPTLVLYGEADEVIHRNSIEALMRRLGRQGHLRTYPGQPHLIMHVANREPVDSDIGRYLAGVASGTPLSAHG
jgi:acylglycerol lipase